MADPLSITASVLTLLAAANYVATGLDRLASLRGAPSAVQALNNELTDLRLALCEAEPLLQKHGEAKIRSAFQDVSWQPTLDRAKDRLADLDSIVGNRLLARMGTRDRLGWMFEQDKVQRALGR